MTALEPTTPDRGESRLPATPRAPVYQLTMLVLSVFVLVTLSVEALVVSDPEVAKVLQSVDLLICAVFFADFVLMFARAPDRLAYMRWGWIDLLSAIPMVDPLRWGRVARIIRIVRVFRAIKSFRVLFETVKASPFETLSVMTTLVVLFAFSISASLIIGFERGLDSPIVTASDALWWATLSILNAKAGMVAPVSSEGVLTTVFLNKVGLLIFAWLNASIIAWLLNARRSVADPTGA